MKAILLHVTIAIVQSDINTVLHQPFEVWTEEFHSAAPQLLAVVDLHGNNCDTAFYLIEGEPIVW